MSIGTPVYIGTGTSSTANLIVTTTTGTGSGDLIFLAIHGGNGHLTGVSDSAGNSYALVDTPNASEIPGSAYSDNSAVLALGGTITLTTTSSAGAKRAQAVSVSGLATTSALDISNKTASGTGTSATPVSSGTLASSNEILFGLMGTTSSEGVFTPGSGFTMVTTATNGSCNVAYLIVATTSAVSWGPSWVSSATYGTDLVSFLAAAVGDTLLGQACL